MRGRARLAVALLLATALSGCTRIVNCRTYEDAAGMTRSGCVDRLYLGHPPVADRPEQRAVPSAPDEGDPHA